MFCLLCYAGTKPLLKFKIKIRRIKAIKMETSQNSSIMSTSSSISKLKSKIILQLRILRGSLIFLIILSLICLLNIPLGIYRLVLQTLAELFQPRLDKILKPAAHLLSFDDLYNKPKFNLCVVHVVEGTLTVEELQSIIKENILSLRNSQGDLVYLELRQFCSRYGGYQFWEWDQYFDINNHVRYYDYDQDQHRHRHQHQQHHHDDGFDLPNPCTEQDLQRIVSNLVSAPWKRNQSPWEFLVIHNYRDRNYEPGKERSVFIIRINHGMCDGYSLLKLIGLLFGSSVRPEEGSSSREIELPVKNKNNLKAPMKLIQNFKTFLGRALRTPFEVPARILELKKTGSIENSWRIKKEDLSANYFSTWTTGVPLNSVKRIKNKFGVSFQSVLSSVIAGGIRRIMMEAGQAVPEKIVVLLPLPVPNHPGGLNIHVTMGMFEFPIAEKDPISRLFFSHEEFEKVRNSTIPETFYKLKSILGTFPSCLVKYYQNTLNTVGISSFPGFQNDVFVGEKLVKDCFFTLGTAAGNGGATVCILTAIGKVRIVATIDRSVFPSQKLFEKFADFIEDEIQDLLDLEFDLETYKL